jgi:hypothetical protein
MIKQFHIQSTFRDIERGEYYRQALWGRNLGGRSIGNSLNNMFSEPVKLTLLAVTKRSFSIIW